jgi:hypothetical protein
LSTLVRIYSLQDIIAKKVWLVLGPSNSLWINDANNRVADSELKDNTSNDNTIDNRGDRQLSKGRARYYLKCS